MLAAAKFGDLPLGGFAGEMLPAARTEPAPPPPQQLVIPPPPWQGTEGHLARTGRRAGSRTTTRRTLGAEAEEPFEPPPLDLEPPLRYEPLVPVAIPPPTWREDEDRLRAAEAQEKLEASRDPYPARPASEKAPRWP
jgi:hypothetical protein